MEVIFNGISSYDFGLGVKKYPPISRPQADIEKIEVPGKDGFLINNLGTFRGISIPVEFNFVGIDAPENASLIKQWLIGSGDLIFSNEIDKKYKATVINSFDIASAIKKFGEFIVVFDCQPHKYSTDNSIITLTTSGTLYNSGGTISKPIIKVFGTGTITLTINGNVINLTNVNEYVVIDSDLVDCYKDTILKNNDMVGDFPVLQVGNNTISWSGSVTKIEVTPNFRWL